MKINYKIKPFVKDEKFDALYKEKREKVELIIGKKFASDYEWNAYKKLTGIYHK